jgi:lysophospholipase L1-like esterase
MQSPRLLVIGASYAAPTIFNATTGAADKPMYGMWQQIGDYIDIEDVWVEGVSGTGFLTTAGGVGTPNNNYLDRIAGHIYAAPDILVISNAFTNDAYTSKTVSAIATQADTYLTQFRAAVPDAKIVLMTGVRAPLLGDNTATYASCVTALQALRQDVYYIDSGLWLDMAGYTPGHTTGTGNSDKYIGSDGIHPTVEGHAYLRARMAPKLQTIIHDDGSLINTVL